MRQRPRHEGRPACVLAPCRLTQADVDITGLSASNTGSCSLFSEVGSYIRPANSSLVVTVQRCDPPTGARPEQDPCLVRQSAAGRRRPRPRSVGSEVPLRALAFVSLALVQR